MHKKISQLAGAAFALFSMSALPQSPPSILVVPNQNVNQGTLAYEAANSITTGTNFQIDNLLYGTSQTASVLFQVLNTSNTTITLLPGFTAIAGNQPGSPPISFKALIGPLATPPMPVNGTQPINTPYTIPPFTTNSTGGSNPILGGDVTFLSTDGSGAQCPVEFVVGQGGATTLSLLDSTTNSDGVCTINAGSSISAGSEVVTVNLNLTFTYPRPEIYTITTDAIDTAGNLFPFLAAGTWTVTAGPAVSGFSPASASQGTPLTIYGSGFGATPGTVALGGVVVSSANVTSWSDATIVLTVPANAHSGLVFVTVGTLTSNSTNLFQFVPADFTMSSPSPSTITAYPTGTPSGSFTDAITGANFTGTINLSYSAPSGLTMSLAPSALSGPGTFSATATAAWGMTQGTYTVTITATGSKSDGTQAVHQVQAQVTVTGPPNISLSPPTPSPVIVSSNQTVTFTETITAVNGFTGLVGFSTPFYSGCFGGEVTFPPSVQFKAANPSQTITGTVVASSGLSNSTVVYQCPFVAYVSGTEQQLFVPVLITAGSTFTVSGPTTAINLYASSTATPVTLQMNPVNGFTGQVNFTTSTANVNLRASTVNVNGTTTAPITLQWTASTVPTVNPVPVTILANGQAVYTILANVQPNPGTTFTLTSSPSSQGTNASGSATFQINVNAASAFTGTVTFSASATGLPAGGYAFTPSTVTGPGATILTVSPPAVATATTYPVTVTGNSNNTSAQTMLYLTANPSATTPATMVSPGTGATIPSTSATFTWNSGVGVSQYQLLVGKSQGMAEYFSSISTSQSLSATGLPSGQSTVYVTLNSLIENVWQPRYYSYAVNTNASSVAPNDASTCVGPGPPVVAYNDNLSGKYSGTFCLDQGDAKYIQSCTVGLGVTATTSSPSGPFWTTTFTADHRAPAAIDNMFCIWDDGSGYPGHREQLTITNAVQVYDATPNITEVHQLGTLIPGGSTYITIWGQNLGNVGTSNKLTFTPSQGNSCGQPGAITYQVTYWDTPLSEQQRNQDQINARVFADPQTACGNYDVQVTSGGESGNQFQAPPQGGSTPQSNQVQAAVVTPLPCLYSVGWSAGPGMQYQMYKTSSTSDWRQDKMGDAGSVLVQNPVWSNPSCSANPSLSDPVALAAGATAYVSSPSTVVDFGGVPVLSGATLKVTTDQASLVFQPTALTGLVTANGFQYEPAGDIISSGAMPSTVSNINANLTWWISFDGGGTYTVFATSKQPIFVLTGAPQGWLGDPTIPTPPLGQPNLLANVTAARLNYVTNLVAGLSAASDIANTMAKSVSAMFGADGSLTSLGSASIGGNPWAVLDGSTPATTTKLDCISQTDIVLVQALQAGVNGGSAEAYPTSNYDATAQKTGTINGQQSKLIFYGPAGDPFDFEGFLYLCGLNTASSGACNSSGPVSAGFTVWPLTAPFGQFQGYGFPAPYSGIAFNVMFYELQRSLQTATSPYGGQQWWVNGSTMLQQQSFPVLLQ